MFKFFKKKPKGEVIKFKISGMHCPSCAMNIDGALEDEVGGVLASKTNYAKSETVVEFSSGTKVLEIVGKIKEVGYQAEKIAD